MGTEKEEEPPARCRSAEVRCPSYASAGPWLCPGVGPSAFLLRDPVPPGEGNLPYTRGGDPVPPGEGILPHPGKGFCPPRGGSAHGPGPVTYQLPVSAQAGAAAASVSRGGSKKAFSAL